MDPKGDLVVRPHGCSFCKNLTDLSAECCCLESAEEMVSVTEPRLLKRGNLKEGELLCPMHYEKLQNGLIFGVGNTGCCAPFHVGRKKESHLRPVPRKWRHLFDTTNIKERYLPSLQICNQCYQITLDLILGGEKNDDSMDWDSDNLSSTTLSGSYTSPRRWISSLSLPTTGSNASSSSLSSSNVPSSYLLSLYETHREKLGRPRAIPDSIRRYFKYQSKSGEKPKLRHTNSFDPTELERKIQAQGSDGVFVDSPSESKSFSSFNRLLSSASLPLPELTSSPTPDPKRFLFQTRSPNISLNSASKSQSLPRTRNAFKRYLSGTSGSRINPNTDRSSSLSCRSSDVDTDWEILSFTYEDDAKSELEEVETSERLTNNEEEQEHFQESNKSWSRDDIPLKRKQLPIKVQSLMNPDLKRKRTKVEDSNATFEKEATENGDQLNTDLGHPSNENSRNGHVLLKATGEENSHVTCSDDDRFADESLPFQSKTETRPSNALNISGTSQLDLVEPISAFEKSSRALVRVFASSLAHCVLSFALHDAHLANTRVHDDVLGTLTTDQKSGVSKTMFGLCDKCGSVLLEADIAVGNFADRQSHEILSNAFEDFKENESQRLRKSKYFVSELSLKTQKVKPPSLITLNAPMRKRLLLPHSQKRTVKWLEQKNCYQTLLSVEVDQFNSADTDALILDSTKRSELSGFPDPALKSRDQVIECVVDDIIPISRSLSCAFINEAGRSQQFGSSSKLIRASSLDSFFTLTCQITGSGTSVGGKFTAVPLESVRRKEAETSLCSFKFEKEREKNDEYDDSSSLSSAESDFSSSSSSLDDCDEFEAELLERRRNLDRPHFVSPKIRSDETVPLTSESKSPAFESNPPELVAIEEEESEKKTEESHHSQDENKEIAQHSGEDTPESVVVDGKENENQSPVKTEVTDHNDNQTKGQSGGNDKTTRSNRSFDWYIEEDVLEKRRGSQLLRALSQAAVLSTKTTRRRETRTKKSDQESEDEDVAVVIGKAINYSSPRIFRRTGRNVDEESEEEEGRNIARDVFRVVTVIGVVGALFYAGLKWYSS